MPHVDIKCYPGRTEEQKKRLAERIAEDVAEIFGTRLGSVSVAIEDEFQGSVFLMDGLCPFWAAE